MIEQQAPTREELQRWRAENRNWGRWGADDQAGAINLITAEKRLEAIGLVRNGRTVSLSRPYPKAPAPHNPNPAQHFMRISDRGEGAGAVVDYYGFVYHGQAMTHIDALCHVWDADGMWNGRDPKVEVTGEGARFSDVTVWSGGIVTRGVLLDVARFRGEPFVTPERPVQGDELAEIARAEGVEVRPGDALIVHSGLEAYRAARPGEERARERPGLHMTCSQFIREHDVSVLGWDMMDAYPTEHGLPWPVHGVLYSYGVALLDNAQLEPLAAACAEEGRYEFLLMILPLRVEGGTGSPVNPVAMF
jgi:kynurenine formamidase